MVSACGSKICDLPHHRVCADVDNDAPTAAFLAERTEKGQIFSFEGLFRVRAFWGAKQWFNFSGEWRVVHFHLDGRYNSQVGGHFLSTDNFHDISPDQFLSGQLGQFAISEALGDRGEHILESLHEGLGLCLLAEGDDSGDEDDDDEHEGEIEIGEVAEGLHDVCDDAEDGADPQHDGEPVCDLLQETDPPRGLLLLRQLVVTLFRVTLYRCLRPHAGLQTGPEAVDQFLHGDLVLIHALDLSSLLVGLAFLEVLFVFGLICVGYFLPTYTFLGLEESGNPLEALDSRLDLSAATSFCWICLICWK